MSTVYDLSFDELTSRVVALGEPSFRARQVWRQLWERGVPYERMADVPRELRGRLAASIPMGVEVLAVREADRGATRKALLRVGGEHVVETVLMGYRGRVTVCVSSQVGCAMGCGFCATGQMGLRNNLTAGEIVAQVVWARGAAAELPTTTPRRLTNVVFMGMGEPLSNERHTFAALGRMTDPGALGIGDRHITMSTVGVVPGIERLGERFPQVGLAVSLHASTDELRDELVPVNRLWPLAVLEDAVAAWRERTHRRPSIEWAMIDRTNDSEEQAERLVPIALRLHAHVNLIPLNPTPGWPTAPSSKAAIGRFVAVLEDAGVAVTVRDTRGREIEAACGQLYHELEPTVAAG